MLSGRFKSVIAFSLLLTTALASQVSAARLPKIQKQFFKAILGSSESESMRTLQKPEYKEPYIPNMERRAPFDLIFDPFAPHRDHISLEEVAILDATPSNQVEFRKTYDRKPTRPEAKSIKMHREKIKEWTDNNYSVVRTNIDIEKIIEFNPKKKIYILLAHNKGGELVLFNGQRLPIEKAYDIAERKGINIIVITCQSKLYAPQHPGLKRDISQKEGEYVADTILQHIAKKTDGKTVCRETELVCRTNLLEHYANMAFSDAKLKKTGVTVTKVGGIILISAYGYHIFSKLHEDKKDIRINLPFQNLPKALRTKQY